MEGPGADGAVRWVKQMGDRGHRSRRVTPQAGKLQVGAAAGLFAAAAIACGVPAGVGNAEGLRCEWSASGEAGEAILAFEIDGDIAGGARAAKRMALTWMAARIEGVGEETDHFARPALALDYRIGADGSPAGPARAEVLISRYSAPDVGAAPKLSEVRVRATGDGVEVGEWSPMDAGAGETRLAKLLRETPPAQLTLDILDMRDGVLASASFRIGDMSQMKRLAAEAREALQTKLEAAPAGATGCL